MVKPDDPRYYPNGDGFSDEEDCERITYEDCTAIGCSDGGFDSKAQGATLVRCTAEGQKRNFRFWGSGVASDCVSVNPKESHFWFGGPNRETTFRLERPVFRGPGAHIRIEAGREGDVITVVDPVLPDGETLKVVRMPGTEMVTLNVEYTKSSSPSEPVVSEEKVLKTLELSLTVDGTAYSGTLVENA